MRTRPRSLWIAMALAALSMAVLPFLGRPSEAEAHPLGNFTVNRYARIELSTDAIHLRYVLDLAEIPAFQERDAIDADGDDQVSPAEREAYLERQAERLLQGLHFTISGAPVELQAIAGELTFPPGQGGLDTQRVVLDFTAPMQEGWQDAVQQVEFRDDNYADRLGWREIVVRSGDGVRLLSSTAPAEDVSDELRAYPEDGLSNPLHVSSATFGFEPGDPPVTNAGVAGGVGTREADTQARAVRGNRDSPLARYADLIAEDQLTFGVIALALLAALGFGAIHALSPGHGKTIVAAYLVGSQGTARHALLLGLTVTVTHTSSVYALGFVTLFLSEYIVPEDLYPWLGIAAGGLILGMGLSLFVGRLRKTGLLGEAFEWLRGRLRATAPANLALAEVGSGPNVRPRAAARPSADRSDGHRNGGPLPTFGGGPAPVRSHSDGASSAHRHGFGKPHDHATPDEQPVTWQNLIGLGIFGGMLPCPSAIVVMLSAIALHRVAFGLLLILAFSVGLAAVLTGIGFILVYAGRISERLPVLRTISARISSAGGGTSFAVRVFPVASAAAVMAAGLVVTLRALAQQGLL